MPGVTWQRLCTENAHQTAPEEGIRPRLRGKAPHQVPEIAGALGPLKAPDVRRKLWRIGDLGLSLRCFRHFPALYSAQRLEERVGAENRQPIVKRPRVILKSDRRLALQQDGPSVQGLNDLHNRDARHRLSPDQGPRDRSGPAVFGEEGGMDVQASPWGDLEDRSGQDLSEGHHDKNLRL